MSLRPYVSDPNSTNVLGSTDEYYRQIENIINSIPPQDRKNILIANGVIRSDESFTDEQIRLASIIYYALQYDPGAEAAARRNPVSVITLNFDRIWLMPTLRSRLIPNGILDGLTDQQLKIAVLVNNYLLGGVNPFNSNISTPLQNNPVPRSPVNLTFGPNPSSLYIPPPSLQIPPPFQIPPNNLSIDPDAYYIISRRTEQLSPQQMRAQLIRDFFIKDYELTPPTSYHTQLFNAIVIKEYLSLDTDNRIRTALIYPQYSYLSTTQIKDALARILNILPEDIPINDKNQLIIRLIIRDYLFNNTTPVFIDPEILRRREQRREELLQRLNGIERRLRGRPGVNDLDASTMQIIRDRLRLDITDERAEMITRELNRLEEVINALQTRGPARIPDEQQGQQQPPRTPRGPARRDLRLRFPYSIFYVSPDNVQIFNFAFNDTSIVPDDYYLDKFMNLQASTNLISEIKNKLTQEDIYTNARPIKVINAYIMLIYLKETNNPNYKNIIREYLNDQANDEYNEEKNYLWQKLLPKPIRWRIEAKHCNNDDTMNILMYTLHKDMDKNDATDPTLAFGKYNNYRCYQTSELEGAFRTYGDAEEFKFAVPDYDPQRPIRDTVTGQNLEAEFKLEDIKQLRQLLVFANNPIFNGLINKIDIGLKILDDQSDELDSLVNSYNQLNEREKYVAKLYLVWMFYYGMWMRFWKGPGKPWPIEWVDNTYETNYSGTGTSPNRCNVYQRDTHVETMGYIQDMLLKSYDDYNLPRVKAFVEKLPLVKYDFVTGEYKISRAENYNTFNKFVNKVRTGDQCMGHGSDIIPQTAFFDTNLVLGLNNDMRAYNKLIKDYSATLFSLELDAIGIYQANLDQQLSALDKTLNEPDLTHAERRRINDLKDDLLKKQNELNDRETKLVNLNQLAANLPDFDPSRFSSRRNTHYDPEHREEFEEGLNVSGRVKPIPDDELYSAITFLTDNYDIFVGDKFAEPFANLFSDRFKLSQNNKAQQVYKATYNFTPQTNKLNNIRFALLDTK